MTKNYEAIIFDLGGVLYDIDVQRTINAFSNLGLQDFQKFYTLKEQTALFDSLEKGFINEDDFVEAIRKMSGLDLSHDQIKTAWNAILIGMPSESVTLLKALRQKGYKLYLLSNTNVFHFNAIQDEMQDKYELNALADLFDEAHYSFAMGMRKPDMEIYHKVVKDNNLSADKTIFIDDNADNVNASILAGLPAVLKLKDQALVDLLKSEGVNF